MAAWSDVGLAVAVGATGVGGTLLATRLQSRYARGERLAQEGRARIERVAGVLGPIQNLLIDLNPPRAMFNLGPNMEWLSSAADKWVPLRDRLSVVAATEPTATARQSLTNLAVAIDVLMNRLVLSAKPLPGVDHSFYEEAVNRHLEAEQLVASILAEVHGGNTGATRPSEKHRDQTTVAQSE